TSGGNSSIKVAVVDTGVAYEDYDPVGAENYVKAPDFASTNFASGYDFVNSDNHPNDDHGHGTAIASMIAESTNNSLGGASLAYNVTIMPIKVCSSLGTCSDYNIASGINYARSNGAKVINLSLGGLDYSPVMQASIDAAWKAGVVVVAATGNDGIGTVQYPGRGSHVIGVGATTSSDSRSSFSNYGSGLDIVAPGSNLVYQKLLCVNQDCSSFSYGYISGTSMSTALVSATAALAYGKAGNVGAAEISDSVLKNTVDLGAIGYDTIFGYGLLKASLAEQNVAVVSKPFGVIKNDSSDYNFYTYNVPKKVEVRGIIGADYWNISGGNNVVASTEIKVGGVSKVGVIKNERGDYNFYLYNFPIGTQSTTRIAADYWNIPKGNNVVGIAGVDVNGDGNDEIAVMKNEKGDYNLYVYSAPVGTQAASLIGVDYWSIPTG
ncbi:MAG: S8 family serine peptidase, partial [Candidatus Saccharibacteria bacterium]|nr:S8 family serine peptidase [Candidatus Saccharibacteria bacterium]